MTQNKCSATQCIQENVCQEFMYDPEKATADGIAVADRYNKLLGWPPEGTPIVETE